MKVTVMPGPASSSPFSTSSDAHRQPIRLPSSLEQPNELTNASKHHSRYYIDDEQTVFLVEQRLFKVHRYFLIRESDVFRMLFELPQRNAGTEGSTDATAITLPDVTVREFECLLDFLYNGMHSDYAPSLKDWINILSITTRFNCDKIRSRAIRELTKCQSKMPQGQQAALAQKYDIPRWLLPGYVQLVMRHKPLSAAEAQQLGPDIAAKIAQAREQVRKNVQQRKSGLVPQVVGWDENWGPESEWSVTEVVKKIFWPHGLPKDVEAEGP